MQRFTAVENEETQLYEAVTRNINTALTILFSIECLLKIFGFGLRVISVPCISDIKRRDEMDEQTEQRAHTEGTASFQSTLGEGQYSGN